MLEEKSTHLTKGTNLSFMVHKIYHKNVVLKTIKLSY